MSALDIINLLARIAALALQVGENALPFIQNIQKWAANDAPQPTQADFDALYAMEKQYLDQLNDTSADDLPSTTAPPTTAAAPESDPNAGQGAL